MGESQLRYVDARQSILGLTCPVNLWVQIPDADVGPVLSRVPAQSLTSALVHGS